ncbi:MAG: FAD-binding oxidoreductase, partial [Dehalococcoidia bacterium]|nr:FAD-binding oxidoreductase [Dehalococcoidia bacterium]
MTTEFAPSSPEEAAQSLRAAADDGIAAVPWGSGTKQIGPLPVGDFALLCTRRLSSIIDFDPDNLTITVGAGATLASVQQAVQGAGLQAPLDPSHAGAATIGGILATGVGGPRRLLYGAPRDLALGVRVALPSGELIKAGGKTVKNVAGFDLTKLFVGSMGTLGLMVEATVRLRPLPQAKRTLLLSTETQSEMRALLKRILAGSQLAPAALEMVNVPASSLIAEGSGLKLRDGQLLLVELEGLAPDVEAQTSSLSELAPVQELRETAALWDLLSNGLPGEVKARAGVPLGNVIFFVEAAEGAAQARDLACPALAQAGCGIVRLFPRPLAGATANGIPEFLR